MEILFLGITDALITTTGVLLGVSAIGVLALWIEE